MILAIDQSYTGLPWKDGGHTRAGVFCAGLAWLWEVEQNGLKAAPPKPDCKTRADDLQSLFMPPNYVWQRGDLILFRERKTGKIIHVAVHLGENRLLHILQGVQSRIDNGLTLLNRVGYDVAGAIDGKDADKVCAVLRSNIGGPAILIPLLISLTLSIISGILMPLLMGHKNKNGLYGGNGQATQYSPETPLPNLLGEVTVAGNKVYQQLQDTAAGTGTGSGWNEVVVLGEGPVNLVDYYVSEDYQGFQLNGLSWQDQKWHAGSNLYGMRVNPAQTETEAVMGNIGGDSSVPSVTFYDAAHAIAVPVDIRASYDRDFPVYGFSGCAYLVLRAINPSVFSSPNYSVPVQGRLVRPYNSSGFIVTAVTNESLGNGNGATVRFKLAHSDIIAVSALTVNGVSYAPISASAQTGNVYQLNATKGYVEFTTAPGAYAIVVSYTCYNRAWSQNPADHIVYLLTEPRNGKGFSADKIDWPSAVALQTYCNASVTYVDSLGSFNQPRYQTNYAIDERKSIQDHIQVILDGCNTLLFCSNGKFVMQAKQAQSSVFSFTTANIMLNDDGTSSFQSELPDRSQKPNVLHFFYQSADSFNAETEATADDTFDQQSRAARLGNGGEVEQELKFPAVTNQQQAEFLANMYLRELLDSKRAYTWKSSIKGLPIQPGDVVDVTHPSIPSTTRYVRVSKIEQDEDDRLVFTADEYTPAAYG